MIQHRVQFEMISQSEQPIFLQSSVVQLCLSFLSELTGRALGASSAAEARGGAFRWC